MKVFVSYSHRDVAFRGRLETHLAPLRRAGLVSVWHDRRIGPGEEWEREIDAHIHDADIILLLVSANFIESDYCWDNEVTVALQRHQRGEAIVVPIILADCDWALAPFAGLQALPTGARPITSWQRRDEAYTDIARALRKLIQGASLSTRIQNVSDGAEPRTVARLPRIRAVTLSWISISVDGRVVGAEQWASLKATEMFLYLLAFRSSGVLKEDVVNALYPGLRQEKLNSAFHGNLYRVRRALFQDAIVKRDNRYLLNPDTEVDWDVENVRAAYNQATKVLTPNHLIPVADRKSMIIMRRRLTEFAPGIESPWVQTIRAELSRYRETIDGWYSL